ncbi:MAG: TPM domain-containing protein, partial [Candidatus Omnitrophota bacterium]
MLYRLLCKLCLFIVLLCAILVPAVFCEDKIPGPQGWVNDFAGIISKEYTDKLNSLIAELEEKTSAEIAVVTVKSIAPYDEKEYARMLFDSWKPGKKGKDNGVLILLALKERRWRIETGYGIEGIIPDGLCGEIGRNFMVPFFKSGDYSKGLYLGTAKVAAKIAENYNLSIDSL